MSYILIGFAIVLFIIWFYKKDYSNEKSMGVLYLIALVTMLIGTTTLINALTYGTVGCSELEIDTNHSKINNFTYIEDKETYSFDYVDYDATFCFISLDDESVHNPIKESNRIKVNVESDSPTNLDTKRYTYYNYMTLTKIQKYTYTFY